MTQPTVVASRRRQHELLRLWSHWSLTSILLDPSEVSRVRGSWSATHHQDPETGERIAAWSEGDGLGFGVSAGWDRPREVIAWSDIEAIAKEVPDGVREQLVEWRQRYREHSRTYPRFAASAQAIGCGPIIEGKPLSPRQEAYVRELEAFDARGVLPAWEQKSAALDAEQVDLHDRALAAVLDQEPADLLALLIEDEYRDQTAVEAQGDLFDLAVAGPQTPRPPMLQSAVQAHRNRPALLPPASRPREAVELRRPSPASGIAR